MLHQILSLILAFPGGSCPGDVNQDGVVNTQDLLAVIADWSCSDIMPTGALKLDGENNTRLRQTSLTEEGIGLPFEKFVWTALVRIDGSRQGAHVIGKRSADDINNFPNEWRLNRLALAGDDTGDPNNHTRLQNQHYDGVDADASHYMAGAAAGVDASPSNPLNTWVAMGGVRDYALIASNDFPVSAVINGVEWPLKTFDVISGIVDPLVPLSIGGLTGSATTNQAEITICNLAIWSAEPSRSAWLAMHGVATPGVYKSPLNYPTGLVSFYSLKNLTDGLVDQVGNNDLIADGGITEVAGPSGVENMTAFSSQPDSTTGVDWRLNMTTGAGTAANGTTIVIGDVAGVFFRMAVIFNLTGPGATDTITDFLATINNITTGGESADAYNLRVYMLDADPVGLVENSTLANIAAVGSLWATTADSSTPLGDEPNELTVNVNAMIARAVAAGWSRVLFELARDDEVTLDVAAFTLVTCENATAGLRPELTGNYTEAAAAGGGGVPGSMSLLSHGR